MRINHLHRPPPLKVNDDSHGAIVHSSSPQYSSSSSSSSASSLAGSAKTTPQQQQQRHPIIIYTHSPKVIHTHPKDFKALVQKLTGLSRSDDDDPSPASASSRRPRVRNGKLGGGRCNDGNNNDSKIGGGNDDNDSSSVITEENCGGGEGQSIFESPQPTSLNYRPTNFPVGDQDNRFCCGIDDPPLFNWSDPLFFGTPADFMSLDAINDQFCEF